jgi:hypothetical protein
MTLVNSITSKNKKILFVILTIVAIGIFATPAFGMISHSYKGMGQGGLTGVKGDFVVKDATIPTNKHIDHMVYISGGTEWTVGAGTYQYDSSGTETIYYMKAFIDDGSTNENWHILDTTGPSYGTTITSTAEKDSASGTYCYRARPTASHSWYNYCLSYSTESPAHIGGISGTSANSTQSNGLPGHFSNLQAKTTGSYANWSTFTSAYHKCWDTVNYNYERISENEFKTGPGDTTGSCTTNASDSYRPHGEYD